MGDVDEAEVDGGVDGAVELSVGLALLDGLDERLAGHHRLDAVRAHLLEMNGEREAAIAHDRAAAGRTTSVAERDYLLMRVAGLTARND